ncbi:1-deoxy-D-xylulose 5-phosphate reductoisomerase [Dirofilaria immitis]
MESLLGTDIKEVGIERLTNVASLPIDLSAETVVHLESIIHGVVVYKDGFNFAGTRGIRFVLARKNNLKESSTLKNDELECINQRILSIQIIKAIHQ